MKAYLLFIVFLLITNVRAQLPHTFTQTAHINDGGNALNVAVGPNGTIFLANSDDGLRAYSYNDTSFINTAHIDDGGNAVDVAVGSDGTVFLASDDGLRAYNYDGSSFVNTAHIYEGDAAISLAIGSDGTIFLVNEQNGLWAYLYNDTSFTNTAHTGNWYYPQDVAVGPDGTVFLAHCVAGLFAFNYDGSSFTNTAHIGVWWPSTIAVNSEGTIFLGCREEVVRGPGELNAYIFNDTSFTNTANNIVCTSPRGITVGIDGTVFLTTNLETLQAYSYNDTSFTCIAYINDTGSGAGVKVGSDGVIFLANFDSGLFAYTYSGYTNIANELLESPSKYSLLQNYPNPFNPITNIEFSISKTEFVTLKIYNILGQEVTTLVSDRLTPGNYKYVWNASTFASGVYFYKVESGDPSTSSQNGQAGRRYIKTKKLILMK